MKKIFLNNKHLIVLMSFVVLIILAITIGYKFYLEQSAKGVIISFGDAIQTGQIEKAQQYFFSNGIFIYNGAKVNYIVGLNNLRTKLQTDLIKSDMYVGEIKNITSNFTTITFVSWLSIRGKSYEASGTAELRRRDFGKWKLSRIESNMWAFGKVFFDMDSSPDELSIQVRQ